MTDKWKEKLIKPEPDYEKGGWVDSLVTKEKVRIQRLAENAFNLQLCERYYKDNSWEAKFKRAFKIVKNIK